MSHSLKNDSFAPDARCWDGWRGRIIRAIVLNDANTKNAVLKATNLKENEFEWAIKALFYK